MRKLTIIEMFLVVFATIFFLLWQREVKEHEFLQGGDIQRAVDTQQLNVP